MTLSAIDYIDYIQYVTYMLIGAGIGIFKAKSIWKGYCGGNGVPQSDELIKLAVTIALYFEFGQIQFLHEKPDYAYLGMQFTVLGISAVSAHGGTLLKKKDAKSSNDNRSGDSS